MVTFGTVALPLSLVVVLGIILTVLMLASFSFASRGFVYDMVMPDRSCNGKRRPVDTSTWY